MARVELSGADLTLADLELVARGGVKVARDAWNAPGVCDPCEALYPG